METIIYIIIALLIYDIIKFTLSFVGEIIFSTKHWNRRMDNPPPPPPRKSFKERLAEKQSQSAKHHRLYQPDNKVDTSNPPKETGT